MGAIGSSENMYIETHAHLGDKVFDTDRKEVIARAFKQGITKIIEIACASAEWKAARDLCALYPAQSGTTPGFSAVFGIHPHYTSENSPANLHALKEYLGLEICAGLGEIGLDYYWDASKKTEQRELLAAQLALSGETGKICVFHARNGKVTGEDAYGELAEILKKNWTLDCRRRMRGVLHCFSGSWTDAVRAVDLGLLLGVNGTFTYKNNESHREIIRKIGIQNFVLETDCPYLPVQSCRGKRNDPSAIPEIGGAVAQYMGMRPQALAEYTTANAAELFDL